MKTYFRIILPIFITVFVYAALSGLFGPKGVYSTRFMETQRDALIQNVNALNSKGYELDCHIKNLTYDPETIALYANELGYIYENEGIIKLVDFNSGFGRSFKPGNLFKIAEPHFLSDYICKTMAISFGILVVLLEMLMTKRYADSKKRR